MEDRENNSVIRQTTLCEVNKKYWLCKKYIKRHISIAIQRVHYNHNNKVRKLSFFVEVWIVKKVGNPLLSGFEKIILDVVDNNNATAQLHLKDPFPPWWFLLSFYSRKRRDPRLCNNKAPMGFNSPVCTAATYRLVWLHRV